MLTKTSVCTVQNFLMGAHCSWPYVTNVLFDIRTARCQKGL